MIESGERVWLSRCQLANPFGVYYGTITANIKALVRLGAANPSFDRTVMQEGGMALPECYDLEMVVALPFRLHSPAAERVRRFVVQRLTNSAQIHIAPIVLCVTR
jgi:hypothetical protein